MLELLVVMGIIALAMAFLLPAIGTSSSRSIDGTTHQLASDLQSARLTALAERTRTRVLLPTDPNDFSGGSAASNLWPSDISSRGYVITSAKRTDTTWRQRGKWTRLPPGVAVDFPSSVALPTPSPAPMVVDVTGTGTATYNYTGPCIEFLANGSGSLDPQATPPVLVVADGFVNPANNLFVPKNRNLRFSLKVDPLSGATTLK